MVNISDLKTGQLHIKPNAPLLTSDFKIGQTLTVSAQQVNGNQLQLLVGKQVLLAEHQLNPVPKGSFQVTVKQTQPTLVLTIPKPEPSLHSSTQLSLQTGYKQSLGSQLAIHQALQRINQLPNLPQNIQTIINQLIELTLKPTPLLNGSQLKTSISNSGLFLENKLRTKSDDKKLGSDTKAQLLKLQQNTFKALEQAPSSGPLKQLSNLISQAINKLSIQQLQLFENPQLFSLELPLANQDRLESIQIEIFRKHTNPNSDWEVILQLNVENDEMVVKLTLNGEQQSLNCQIWCETDPLKQRVTRSLEQLSNQLKQLGLELTSLTVTETKPQQSNFTTQVTLIDIKV